MDPQPSTRTRRGLSLEHKLPLLITALLVVVIAGGVFSAHNEVRQSAVESATERLRLLSQQLAGIVGPTVPERLGRMRAAAGEPAVLAFLAAPGAATRPGAEAALEPLREGGALALLVLWDAGREPLLRLGTFPDSAAGDTPMAIPDQPGLLPESAGAGPFFQAGDRSYFWLVTPVERGGATAGYLGELRRLGSPDNARSVAALLGHDITLFFANTGRGAWVAMDGTAVPAPARWPFTGAVRYTHGERGDHFGYAAPVRGTQWVMVAEQPLATVMARPAAFLRRSALAALLLCLAGAALAWLLSRTITRPLRALGLAADAVARGDYARRTALRRTDELGVLAERFDWMAAQVEATHGELTQQYETAQALAEELEVAASEAEAARREAEAANRSKSDFLATMSHEIRTPINAIIGYTELLQLGLEGPVTAGQQAQLERIGVSGRHLTGLVDQVLDFARIEAGTLRVERRTAGAAEAARTALDVLRPEAERKGVHLSAECEGGDGLRYVGDPQRVDQVLLNLLSNAVKFTEAGGRATVRCEAREGALPAGGAPGRWTCLSVEDTGIGIAPEQRERIFEPFIQVESGYTRRHGGSGLGLAISLKLARSMGGDLTVESEPGRGSRFTLWLPAADA